MDIKVSYNWLREYCQTKLKPEELARLLSLHSVNVERIHHEGRHLEKVLVGQILKIEKHPNADKLKVAQVDIGTGKPAKIVCGGTNIYQGMKVAVALPGAKVRWHGSDELTELKAAKIREVESQGMVCAANELGLAELFPEYKEREVLDLKIVQAPLGTALVDALQLYDAIYDIEVTSNRPDLLGIVGLAREASAVTNSTFLYKEPKTIKPVSQLPLKIQLQAKNLCYRYQGLAIAGVKVAPSPWWLQKRLRQVGLRPINNVVDVTNYVLLEYGQPMHAFDYDRLAGQRIIIRKAQSGEKIRALDGQGYQLSEKNLVIADAKKPLAIAGVMGGEESAVWEKTKDIVLESANFDAVSVRHTARQLNLHSDSSARFEKYLNTESTQPAIWRAAQIIMQLAGGKVASQLFDLRSKTYKPRKISLNIQTVTDQVGVEIKQAKISSILKSLGFKISGGKKFSVIVPWWRHEDVENDRDLVEEVARLYGYHNLPSELPVGRLYPAMADVNLFWEGEIRKILESIGLTEIYSYSMVSEKILKAVAVNPESCLKLHNPLNDDLVYLRPTLMPSLLQVISENEGHHPEQKVFELSNIYLSKGLTELPEERATLAGALTGKDWQALFSQAKGVLEQLLIKLGINLSKVTWQPAVDEIWIPSRSGKAVLEDGQELGTLGEVSPGILSQFGIKSGTVAWQFNARALASLANNLKHYKPLPKFPAVNLDLAMLVKRDVTWQQIAEIVKRDGGHLVESVEIFDLYQGKGVPADSKSVAFHIVYRSHDRTLSLEEAQNLQNKVIKSLEQKLKAQVRK